MKTIIQRVSHADVLSTDRSPVKSAGVSSSCWASDPKTQKTPRITSQEK